MSDVGTMAFAGMVVVTDSNVRLADGRLFSKVSARRLQRSASSITGGFWPINQCLLTDFFFTSVRILMFILYHFFFISAFITPSNFVERKRFIIVCIYIWREPNDIAAVTRNLFLSIYKQQLTLM